MTGLAWPRVTSLPRTIMRPFVKLTSSRICSISSHPALRRAGVMNLVHMSRSLSWRLSMHLRDSSGVPHNQGRTIARAEAGAHPEIWPCRTEVRADQRGIGRGGRRALFRASGHKYERWPEEGYDAVARQHAAQAASSTTIPRGFAHPGPKTLDRQVLRESMSNRTNDDRSAIIYDGELAWPELFSERQDRKFEIETRQGMPDRAVHGRIERTA
jgi:hypothetical protein